MADGAARDERDDAWYRNGWVWLVIGIPAATVLGGLLTIYLALAHPDELVHDDDTARTTEQGRP